MSMGNHQFFSGLTALKVLREMGCTLPMEIFFLGENDLSVENREVLLRLGNVKVIDLYILMDSRPEGWACKPFVMLLSS